MSESQDYRRLFEESPTAIYVYGRKDFQFLAANEAALSQYGYSRSEFMRLTARDIRPKDELSAFYKANENLPEEYYDAGRWQHKGKDGAVFFVRVYTHRLVFAGTDAVVVVAANIDKKVRLEHELMEKSRETEVMLNSITDGFFAINRDWEFTYVNKECERIFLHTREELIGKNVWELFPQGKDLKFYGEYFRVMEEQVSAHFEEYDPVYGTWVAVNAYPTRDGVAVYFTDVTERKKTEEQIFRDKENLRAIINNTRDIIWSIDAAYQIISANDAFWGRLAQLVGKPSFEINEHDYTPELFATWREYFQRGLNGEYFQITWEHQLNGETNYELISFNPMRDRDGDVMGISCFSRDITAQKKHEQKIEQQNEQLRTIAWIQSHQVRNHVTTIMGLMQLMDVSLLGNADNAGLFQMMRQSVEDLDAAIHEINKRTQSLD